MVANQEEVAAESDDDGGCDPRHSGGPWQSSCRLSSTTRRLRPLCVNHHHLDISIETQYYCICSSYEWPTLYEFRFGVLASYPVRNLEFLLSSIGLLSRSPAYFSGGLQGKTHIMEYRENTDLFCSLYFC
ncbi:hypothetical protein VPH35_007977 [Triticum aestivum]